MKLLGFLLGAHYQLHPDGTYGPGESASFTMRNGEGIVIFKTSKVPPPEEIEP